MSEEQFGECQWSTSPKTLEEMLNSCKLLLEWEHQHGRSVPHVWCPIIPTSFMADLLHRFLIVERQVSGG